MKTLLFLDYGFHKKTNSFNFLIDILKQEYDITFQYFALSGKAVDSVPDPKAQYFDVVVFAQVFPDFSILENYKFGKAVFFPMYDAVIQISDKEWLTLQDFLIISFSKILYEKLDRLHLHVKYIQYFPRPRRIENWGNPSSLFLWQRKGDIHANSILNICQYMELKKLHVHKAVDPGYYFISVSDRFEIQTEYSNWFEDIAEMYKTMQESALYAAPRMFEGIGMSFLDAMANGRCVIAPNLPTMNEYITDKETGLLYNYGTPIDPSETDILHIQKNTLAYIEKGYRLFEQQKFHILDWIKETSHYPNAESKPYNHGECRGPKCQYAFRYCELFNKWLLIRNRKESLDSYFVKHGISNIALYGYNHLARRLGEELGLETACTKVMYYMDQKVPFTESGEQIKREIDKSVDVDAIVVAAVAYFDEIKAALVSVTDVPVLSLEEIIDTVLKWTV